MSRQLNPGLFGDTGSQGIPQGNEAPFSYSENLSFFEDSNILGEDLGKLRQDFEKLRFESQDTHKTANLRVDKLIQRLLIFEERLTMLQKETHQRCNDISSKVRDFNMSETKIESMIERHNQIVQSFELRISQAQKLIENQSLQLAKQQEMIDDARRQIERLKKL